ncbi:MULTISPECIES: hypothetical protein [Streptomycetaceae]|uniref:Uncharacterized protein n=1 Tax=Streptantibioticus cattleyicolor (strain ATCC 35852 / DSM 46488 / JCM 4925 / NBRC 14057 / NRRL 8057) TaxID=1003195 RepID=G8WWN0_STREN|nr:MULTISPECIES: hypothetical protein [Streptomycetaceae]AEW94917.1 hypothetical protein SCATT_25460 [Streptantibioticus cattleyicolor NRRL 8057 = DSM 46488]MYS59523.1 hypothetical protein [Streptomyces sp. SID5468]
MPPVTVRVRAVRHRRADAGPACLGLALATAVPAPAARARGAAKRRSVRV